MRGGGADQHGRPDPLDDLFEPDAVPVPVPVRDLGRRAGVRHLEVAQIPQVVGQQALLVDRPDAARGRLAVEAVADHRVAQLVGDADARRTCAEDDDPLVARRCARDADGGQCRREHDRAGALHVVVEGGDAAGVPLQDAAGVGRAEVLPVQQRAGEQVGGRRDVGVDEVVVASPPRPRVPVTDVEGVVEQLLVVGADVQRDRDDPGGVDSGGGGVDGQLARGDAGAAAHSPVADAQDLLCVGGDDQVHVAGAHAEVAEGPLDALRVVDGQVDAPWPAVLLVVAPDRLRDRRVVHDREHLAQVVGQEPVEQHLVAVL